MPSQSARWCTVSNALTLLRLCAAPFLVILFYQEAWFYAWVLFVVAGLTDLLDGYLARALRQQTWLGTVLDPLADKALLLATFGSLTFVHSPMFHIPVWFFVLVLARETCLIIGSAIALVFYKHVSVTPTWTGKATTALQMLFLGWIFVCYFMGWLPHKTYGAFLIGLLTLLFLSFLHYVARFLVAMR